MVVDGPEHLPYRTVALDTSHWATWLDALGSENQALKVQAQAFYNDLIGLRWIPILTGTHIIELMGSDRALQRLKVISQIKCIGWIRGFNSRALGSYIDIKIIECLSCIEGAKTSEEVRERSKPNMILFGSGQEALGEGVDVWMSALPIIRASAQADRDIMSIQQISFFDDTKKVKDLFGKSVGPVDHRKAEHKATTKRVAQEVRERGVQGASDPDALAAWFMEEPDVRFPQGTPAVRAYLADYLEHGVKRSEITPDTTLKKLGDIAEFRMSLRIVERHTGIDWEWLRDAVDMDACPHWVIHTKIRDKTPRTGRPEGGTLNDWQLSALAGYVDVLYVDKRISEAFRQAARDLSTMVCQVRKARDFSVILEDLASLT